MIDETLKAFTEDMALPDRAIHSAVALQESTLRGVT